MAWRQVILPVTIGNDIVDLSIAAQKHAHERFLNRVFTSNEKSLIASHVDKHCLLWALWAAKEAAFKAYQKQQLDYVFSPVEAEVIVPSDLVFDWSAGLEGEVIIRGHPITCRWYLIKRQSRLAIHCVAHYPAQTSLITSLKVEYVESCDEYKALSQKTRQLALSLCREKGLHNVSIERPPLDLKAYTKFGPPILMHNGIRLPHELSLSHDGHFLAVTLGQKT